MGLVLAALLTGCSTFQGTGDLDYVAGQGAVTQVAPEEREEPVEIAGETLDGDRLDLADLRGTVVVVNVWGSWCGPCKAEMPMLVDAYGETDRDEVSFVGIDIRETDPANARAFEREVGVEYPSFYDPGSELLLRFGKRSPYATPSTLVLDDRGRVAALISGEIPSKRTLLDLVEEVAAEGGDG
ncbi:TlpA family protein disulfide reductase [Nocardioides panacisoli]|uniref:TlpA disulfide reductase family protein n=1 Tax=Nocardioides panacisoli TaxID=627624 RepID=UPI001C631CE9|nr:TlpA disulfide reductase family protein [Nocardioides panacisoli]QYJ03781.1 TlpA family protein disulfide reductase [Nocardioides panacisoli]